MRIYRQRKYTAEVYKDESGEWRWRITAGNGNIVAVSGEGYKRVSACMRILRKLLCGDIGRRCEIILDKDKHFPISF